MRLAPLLAACSMLLSACTTGELMAQMKPGMSKDEVTQLLGNPDGYQARGEYESLRYSNRLISGWAWDRADYNVVLKEGKVTEYGPGGDQAGAT